MRILGVGSIDSYYYRLLLFSTTRPRIHRRVCRANELYCSNPKLYPTSSNIAHKHPPRSHYLAGQHLEGAGHAYMPRSTAMQPEARAGSAGLMQPSLAPFSTVLRCFRTRRYSHGEEQEARTHKRQGEDAPSLPSGQRRPTTARRASALSGRCVGWERPRTARCAWSHWRARRTRRSAWSHAG